MIFCVAAAVLYMRRQQHIEIILFYLMLSYVILFYLLLSSLLFSSLILSYLLFSYLRQPLVVQWSSNQSEKAAEILIF